LSERVPSIDETTDCYKETETMSGRKKMKPRQQRKPRNLPWIQHMMDGKGGPHVNGSDKRKRQKGEYWENEEW